MNYFNISKMVYFSVLSKATSTGTQHWSHGGRGEDTSEGFCIGVTSYKSSV